MAVGDAKPTRGLRTLIREAKAIGSIWWLIVPGGALGVVAIVEFVRGEKHQGAWFWVALAMTALWLATAERLRRVLKEKDRALAVVEDERSAEAVAERLDGIAHELQLLKDEIPPENEGVGPVFTELMSDWVNSLNHLQERARSELRRNASGFLDYWLVNPDPMPPPQPFSTFATTMADFTSAQAEYIAGRVRNGHSEPEPGVKQPEARGTEPAEGTETP